MHLRPRKVGPLARRCWPVLLCLTLFTGLAATAGAEERYSIWRDYAQRFITGEGRVMDTGNNNFSHTEGQGWAMLFAEAFDDRARFDALWNWTREHLDVLDSGLLAWRYEPGETPPVQDLNNASDGDLLIAWALHRAARKWRAPEYERQSRRLRGAIERHLIRDYAGYSVLLPARRGFEHDGYVVLNLSYWVMPALQEFALAEPDGPWRRLLLDGERLLRAARFGAHKLPPDWLSLTEGGELRVADQWPPRFGFEAVRVPLYAVWAGRPEQAGLEAVSAYWRGAADDRPPAWVNLVDGDTADYPLSRGGMAVRSLLLGMPGKMPEHIRPEDDYYSASLLVLSWLAAFLPEPAVPRAPLQGGKRPRDS
ncbi:MAG: endoglucanase [Alcanivorax sp.]|nr:endoglucanase [Alcanivorax sp.]NQY83400.1 endoglucanase [Alcanivorax sp.]